LGFADQYSYRERLLTAQRSTGLREAALVGEARIVGTPVVLIVFDFAFMGGTMGSVVGEKVADAFEYATRHRRPVVSVVASGGARMQEGMLSLMQMAKTDAAQEGHHRAGLVYISILTHPTFGGVAASFASLGDVIIAEPKAQVGFVGPRVIEKTLGMPLPPNSHSVEDLFRAGMVDQIVARANQRAAIAYLIAHLSVPGHRSRTGRGRPRRRRTQRRVAPLTTVWERVQLARHPSRPTTVDYITRLCGQFVEFHGDRHFGDDPAIVCGVGDIGNESVIIIGHERGRNDDERRVRRRGMAYPEGYRKALRVMHLAAKFRLPILTLIDTPGAYPGLEAEQRGLAQALAQNLQAMAGLPTPIVSVVIGEGGSGGALSLGMGDRVLMLEHAIYSVISPEGASTILWGEPDFAQRVAEALKITAADLLRLRVIDTIIPEPPGGAHVDPDLAARHLKTAVLEALREVRGAAPAVLLSRRYQRYRHIGQVGVYWREAMRTEMHEVLDAIERRLSHPRNPHEPADGRPPRAGAR
jgi:acetyl-CoA carboxylase carboxyl transferase subunit beta